MKSFDDFVGNELIINSMKKAIKNNRISHFYTIDGESGTGKSDLANLFAKSIQCQSENKPCGICTSCKTFDSYNNLDVHYVVSEKKTIGVEEVRTQINSIVNIKPYKCKYKIFIIDNADTMTVSAQNAVLKIVEEPPSYGVFIFLTQNYNKLLTTILSRCILMRLKPVSKNEVYKYLIKNNIEENIAKSSSYVSNIGKALKFSNDSEHLQRKKNTIDILKKLKKESIVNTLLSYEFFQNEKDNIEEVLNIIQTWYRDLIVYKNTKNYNLLFLQNYIDEITEEEKNYTTQNLIKKLDTVTLTKDNLTKNANFQMTIEVMLLKLKEK